MLHLLYDLGILNMLCRRVGWLSLPWHILRIGAGHDPLGMASCTTLPILGYPSCNATPVKLFDPGLIASRCAPVDTPPPEAHSQSLLDQNVGLTPQSYSRTKIRNGARSPSPVILSGPRLKDGGNGDRLSPGPSSGPFV